MRAGTPAQTACLALLGVLLSAPALAQEEPAPEAPAGWTCSASYYGSGDGCDCGCGIQDSDCTDSAPETCEYDWCGTNETVDPADPTQCIAEAPPAPGWTCSNGYYGAGDGCDCGCGAPDPDCASTDLSACEYNNCDEGNAPTAADPSQCAPGEFTPPADDGSDDPVSEEPPADDGADDEPASEEPADEEPSTGAPVGEPEASTGDDSGGVELGDDLDDGGAEEPPPSAGGGCSATPAAPAASLLFALALLAFRRRRG